MFTITSHKGFHLKFENGYSISVQWGPGNYCDHYMTYPMDKPAMSNDWKSKVAEIAIWNPSGQWLSFGCDTVKGHVSVDEVADWILRCAIGSFDGMEFRRQ
jgi:hypothetical protein